ncbi:hypothetical protein Ssi03_62880 [Sphaerisporangium siamense]|nr:hypothetical protein Ssi03_62880 [Sphaerisporangium siamense]
MPPGPSSCPDWCEGHYDDDIPGVHRGQLRRVPLLFAGRHAMLFTDLVQCPGEEGPRIHLRVDERPLVQLTPGEASRLGIDLVVLGDQARAERDRRG